MPVFEEINFQRRRFFSQAALTIAATQLGMLGSASALSSKETGAKVPAVEAATKAGTHTSFDSMKQIDAGLLNVGYAEAGPANGTAVVLLHGWPYDIYSYVDVAPLLASAGYRVIVPYLRGYGSTRFLASETCRNGQQSVVALDRCTAHHGRRGPQSAARSSSGLRTGHYRRRRILTRNGSGPGSPKEQVYFLREVEG
jgi:hypothetical protein